MIDDWQESAACLALVRPCPDAGCQHDRHDKAPELDCPTAASFRWIDWAFFSDAENRIDGRAEYAGTGNARALEVCQACPVTEQCLRTAAKANSSWRYGIFGGLRPAERPRLPGGAPNLAGALTKLEKKRKEAHVA